MKIRYIRGLSNPRVVQVQPPTLTIYGSLCEKCAHNQRATAPWRIECSMLGSVTPKSKCINYITQNPLNAFIRCPVCNGDLVDYDRSTRRFVCGGEFCGHAWEAE